MTIREYLKDIDIDLTKKEEIIINQVEDEEAEKCWYYLVQKIMNREAEIKKNEKRLREYEEIKRDMEGTCKKWAIDNYGEKITQTQIYQNYLQKCIKCLDSKYQDIL